VAQALERRRGLSSAGKQRFPWAQSGALRKGCCDSLDVLGTF
jgi:hypothetical protein